MYQALAQNANKKNDCALHRDKEIARSRRIFISRLS